MLQRMILGLTLQQALFFLILVTTMVLLISEKVRPDLTALLLIISLYSAGLLTAEESLSGFGSEAAITVAAIFVLSAALHATGVSEAIGNRIGSMAGSSYYRAIAVVVPSVALFAAFTHHVTTTALMLPVVLRLSERQNVPPSKFLMPLSIAASFGTTITVIGAPAFLIASNILHGAGHPGLRIFSIAPIGLALSALGTIFLLAFGWPLLPSSRGPENKQALFRLDKYLTELTIPPESPYLGKTVAEVQAMMHSTMEVLGFRRGGRDIRGRKSRREVVRTGDVLLVRSQPEEIVAVRREHGVELNPVQKFGTPEAETAEEKEDIDKKLVQAVLAPNSELLGRTIAEIDFYRRFEAIVVGLWRKHGWLEQKLSNTILREGDVLLLQGGEEALRKIGANPAFLLLVPFHSEVRLPRKAPLASLIMAAVVLASALNLLPVELSALAGAAAIVLFRCLSARQAYEAVDIRIYVFIAGVVPLGRAMEKCGASALAAQWLQQGVGSLSEFWILLLLFAVVSLLTQFMSDAATTAIFAPVALALANGLGHSPEAYVVTVAMAAVVAFLTPLGHHGNLLVYGPGGYKFSDFIKVGTPLTVLSGIIVALLAPRLW